MPYKWKYNKDKGELTLLNAEVMSFVPDTDRPDFKMKKGGVDAKWLTEAANVLGAKEAKGKAAYLFLRHNEDGKAADIVGRVRNAKWEEPWIRGDYVVTNPEVIGKLARGELPERSAEFQYPNHNIYGLSLTMGEEGHFSEELPALELAETSKNKDELSELKKLTGGKDAPARLSVPLQTTERLIVDQPETLQLFFGQQEPQPQTQYPQPGQGNTPAPMGQPQDPMMGMGQAMPGTMDQPPDAAGMHAMILELSRRVGAMESQRTQQPPPVAQPRPMEAPPQMPPQGGPPQGGGPPMPGGPQSLPQGGLPMPGRDPRHLMTKKGSDSVSDDNQTTEDDNAILQLQARQIDMEWELRAERDARSMREAGCPVPHDKIVEELLKLRTVEGYKLKLESFKGVKEETDTPADDPANGGGGTDEDRFKAHCLKAEAEGNPVDYDIETWKRCRA
ncbi:MAG: hypothetical protein GY835_22495 [bacterium]|nr:hypothetical protein [bacterium]